MEAFEYLAVDAQGRDRRGVLEGDTSRQVRQRLRDLGLTPLEVREAAASRAMQGRERARIGADALALATRQLATLIGSGTSIEDALDAVARQSTGRAQHGVLLGVRGQILEGRSLAQALATYPGTFAAAYRASVAAGERAGTLGAVLDGVAAHLESAAELRRTVALALLYPAILTLVALLVLAAMLAYVVPQVVQVFTGAGQALPWLTRAIIAVSALLRDQGPVLSAGAVALVFAARAGLARPRLRDALDALWLRVPLVSRLVRSVNAARFAGTLATLVGSGVALVDALDVAAGVVSSAPMRRAVQAAAQRVAEGESLSTALARGALFPPVMVELIASGEGSGRLDSMLARAAQDQERDARTLVRVALALLEPLLTLAMGAAVLIVVMAILLPLFELNRLVG